MGRYQIEKLMAGGHWIITEMGGLAAYDGRIYGSLKEAQAAMDQLVASGQAEDKPLELALELEGVA